jgi:hypothetical protein
MQFLSKNTILSANGTSACSNKHNGSRSDASGETAARPTKTALISTTTEATTCSVNIKPAFQAGFSVFMMKTFTVFYLFCLALCLN